MASAHKDVKFLGLDAHANMDTCANFGVMSLPTLLFFKGGKEVARLVGFQAAARIETELKKVRS